MTLFLFGIANCGVISNDIEDDDDNGYISGVPLYTLGRACASVGGICVSQLDCAPGHLTSKKGLCPDRDLGVECCYQVIPREDATCESHQGSCRDQCPELLSVPGSTDCPAHQQCCVNVY